MRQHRTGSGGAVVPTVQNASNGNLRQWTDVVGGGVEILPEFMGESNVLNFGASQPQRYGWQPAEKYAAFTTVRPVGPTNAVASCSPLSLDSGCAVSGDAFIGEYNYPGTFMNQTAMTNRFTAKGGLVGNNQPKPSNLMMSISVMWTWSIAGAGHDNQEDPLDPFNGWFGVYDTAVGDGDLLWIHRVGAGVADAYQLFTGLNTLGEFAPSDPSVGFCDGGWPITVWMEQVDPLETYHIFIAPPNSYSGTLNLACDGSPVDSNYYIALHIYDTCEKGLTPIPGSTIGSVGSGRRVRTERIV